jgi:hypothetical protein
MKKLLFIIGIIIILIAIGIVSFIFFSPKSSPGLSGNTFPISSDQQVPQPDVYATNFYKWYILQFKNDVDFNATPDLKKQLLTWVTPQFADQFENIIQSTGSDPVLLAQDYQDSWLTDVSSSVLSNSGTAATILVSLGSVNDLHQLVVNLVLVDGYWRVNSVTKPASATP